VSLSVCMSMDGEAAASRVILSQSSPRSPESVNRVASGDLRRPTETLECSEGAARKNLPPPLPRVSPTATRISWLAVEWGVCGVPVVLS